MALSDPIADMLTRIRNALENKAKTVECLNSGVCRGIAQVLVDEGYVTSFTTVEDGRHGKIKIALKYGPRGEILINKIHRESKPGRRVYRGVAALPRPIQGLGIAVMSTSKGVMSDRKARDQRVGGELLCVVQ